MCVCVCVSVQRNRGLNSIFKNIELAIYYERGLFSVFFNANHTCLRPLDPEISVTKGRLIKLTANEVWGFGRNLKPLNDKNGWLSS